MKFFKVLRFQLTSGNNLSSNIDTQVFLPILSMKWSACSERNLSNALRKSLTEGNKIVGSNFVTTSLYARYKIRHSNPLSILEVKTELLNVLNYLHSKNHPKVHRAQRAFSRLYCFPVAYCR